MERGGKIDWGYLNLYLTYEGKKGARKTDKLSYLQVNV